jgi:hypothetical protein
MAGMLTIFISSETQARLITLVDSAKDDSTKLDHLHNQVEQLRRGVAVESLSAEAQTQLQSLLGISEHACEVIIQYRVLENLAFEGMYGRYETVDDAHFKTLRWIFNGNLDNSQTEDEAESVLSVEDDLNDHQPGDGTENLSNSGENSNYKKPGQNNESAVSLGEISIKVNLKMKWIVPGPLKMKRKRKRKMKQNLMRENPYSTGSHLEPEFSISLVN